MSPDLRQKLDRVTNTLFAGGVSNPITYIADATDLPAFSIAAGDADCNVPYQQSEILADAIAQGKVQQSVQQAQMKRAEMVEPAKD